MKVLPKVVTVLERAQKTILQKSAKRNKDTWVAWGKGGLEQGGRGTGGGNDHAMWDLVMKTSFQRILEYCESIHFFLHISARKVSGNGGRSSSPNSWKMPFRTR